MPLPTPPMLLTFMLAGELWLMRSRLSKDTSREADRGSLRLLLIVIGASVGLAWQAKRTFPQANFDVLFNLAPAVLTGVHWMGLVIFFAGICLRWYSMAHLGRLFTFDVAVAADHRVIDSGPYHYIRHPAYSGSLLSFVGLGVCGGNAVSLLALVAPIVLAFSRRIAIEEAALTSALGHCYSDYAERTKRLLPYVY